MVLKQGIHLNNDDTTDNVTTFEQCIEKCRAKTVPWACGSCDYEFGDERKRCALTTITQWTGNLVFQTNWHYAEDCSGESVVVGVWNEWL